MTWGIIDQETFHWVASENLGKGKETGTKKKNAKSRVWGWEKEKRPGRNSPLQPLEAALVFLISK